MAQRFKWLRGLGDFGGKVADLLTLLMTNWQLVLSALIALAAGGLGWLRAFVSNPITLTIAGVFLAALWTTIGLLFLVDRRKPRLVQTHQDYRYGLTFEGLTPNFIPANSGMPSAGGLQLALNIRNFSPGPVKYSLEAVDIRLGSRTTQKYKANDISGNMARGAGRQSRPHGFEAKSLKEFYGAGVTKGTADFSITYGPVDGPAVRRLKISMEIYFVFPKDGAVGPEEGQQLGYSDNIVTEIEEDI